MVGVAKEMQRRGLQLPLLIGGATTSKQHTAVKIAPEYTGGVVHVLDASRAVGVVSALLDEKQKHDYQKRNLEDQARLRAIYSGGKKRPLLSFDEARARAAKLPFNEAEVCVPAFLGVKQETSFSLSEIAKYIDWSFFFIAWELKGRFPGILENPEYGEAARELYDNGLALLERIIDEKLLTASASYGFWPACSQGEDIVLFADESRERELLRFNMLRQQQERSASSPLLCLADYVAPKESGVRDYLGAFAVTAGIGTAELAEKFEREHDDYNAIMVKALADRLAEAYAEMLHERVRREWGYETGERLSNEELIHEKYRGIRPAFGYPACPDHTEKWKLFELLQAEQVGIALTDGLAMTPAASVSGIYLSHPQSKYFSVGQVGRDQVEAYAKKKGMSLQDMERWIRPNLGYDG
jgi:5-methyltetrahydrofolate--homocysteine methyltransferase